MAVPEQIFVLKSVPGSGENERAYNPAGPGCVIISEGLFTALNSGG